jgi:hypothetical protein
VAELLFQAGHGAQAAQALRLGQPVALARPAAELLPEEPDAALVRRQEAPVARDAPVAAVAAVAVAGRQPEAVPDGAAVQRAAEAEPVDAEGPPAEGEPAEAEPADAEGPPAEAVRDAAVRRQAAA